MTEVRASATAVRTFVANQTLYSTGNFTVRYSVDSQLCAASATVNVACAAGYDSVGDQCIERQVDSFCSNTMSVRSARGALLSRTAATVLSDDALAISFEGGADVDFQLLPLKDAYNDNVSATQSMLMIPMAGKLAGVYRVLATRKGKQCSVIDTLTLTCRPGYEPDSQGNCVKENVCRRATLAVASAMSRVGR